MSLFDDEHETPDYHRGPGQGRRRGRPDWTGHPDRVIALTVRCQHCTAPAGVICRNLHSGPMGAEVPFDQAPDFTALPAHPIRVTDAKRARNA